MFPVRNALFGIFILFQLFELANITYWFVKGKALSPFFAYIYQSKTRSWVKRRTFEIDLYGTLVYFVAFFIISCSVLLACTYHESLVIIELLVLQLALVLLLAEFLHWTQRSVRYYFNALQGELDGIRIVGHRGWQERVAEIRKNEIERFHASSTVPHFVARISIVIVGLILIYSVIYFQLSRVQPGSFMDTNGNMVGKWGAFLYYSAIVTSTLDTDVLPVTRLARLFVALHGLANIYSLVLAISVFTTMSEDNIARQKDRLLNHIRQLLGNGSDSGQE